MAVAAGFPEGDAVAALVVSSIIFFAAGRLISNTVCIPSAWWTTALRTASPLNVTRSDSACGAAEWGDAVTTTGIV